MHRIRIAFLMALALCIFPLAHATAKVVISEIFWSGSDLSSADEWIELANTGTGGTISGWILTRLSGGKETQMLLLPSGSAIGSGETFLISNYSADESRLAITPNLVSTDVSLANTQLLIRLYNEHGVLMDTVDDGIGAPFAGSSGTPKASMERIVLTGSGQMKTNWQTATTSLNFDDGAAIFGTPGAPNGMGPTADTTPPMEALMFTAEIIETSVVQVSWIPSASLDLASQILTYNRQLNGGTGMILAASATGVTFSNAGLPAVASAEAGTGITFTLRSRDASGNTSSGITAVSRLFPNIKITEVLANPMGNDAEEWIEIGNLGKETVDIGGWILDEGNSSGNFHIPLPTALAPQEFRIFPKSLTGLPLDNGGERVSLMRGFTLMDSWEYPETAEEVSYGRKSNDANVLHAFCVPTPGKSNEFILPDPRIIVQGNPDVEVSSIQGEGKLTLNLMATVMIGSTAHAQCVWNFGDGYASESCNPPSHSIQTPGTYLITLSYRDVCGNVAERFLEATVAPAPGRYLVSPKETRGEKGAISKSEKKEKEPCIPKNTEGVRISEVLPDPDGDDADGEWIELENALDEDISLCGWKIDDDVIGSTAFALDGEQIGAKQFMVLSRMQTNIALNNTSDAVRLFSPDGDLIDAVLYEKSHAKKSFARGKDGTFAWTEILTPGLTNRFPGDKEETKENKKNTLSGTTLDAESSVSAFSGGISLFSEILSNPTKEGQVAVFGEYLELMNPLDEAISLAGWILDDATDGSSKPKKLTEDYVIAPQSRLLLCKGTGCDLPLKVSLNNEGEEISLTSPDGTEQITVTYPKLKQGTSYARNPRQDSAWCVTKIATPKGENICRSPALAAKKKSPKKSASSKKTTTSDASKESDDKPLASSAFGGLARGEPDKPSSALRIRYRHIYAEPAEGPEPAEGKPEPEISPLLTSILSKTHQPRSTRMTASAFSPLERYILHLGVVCGLLMFAVVGAGMAQTQP